MNYEGPQLDLVVRDPKTDSAADIVQKILGQLADKAKVGLYLKDKEDGELTKASLKLLDEKSIQKIELKDFMDTVHTIKIKQEVDNVKVAAKFAKWTFDNLINAVEDIIENEYQHKHNSIQKKVESMLEKEESLKKFLVKNPGTNGSHLEYSLPVLIQSGEVFNLNKF